MAKRVMSDMAKLYGVEPAVWRAVVKRGSKPRLATILRATAVSPETLSLLEDFPEPKRVSESLAIAWEVWGSADAGLKRVRQVIPIYARSTRPVETLKVLMELDPDMWCWCIASMIERLSDTQVSGPSSWMKDSMKAIVTEIVQTLRDGSWPKPDQKLVLDEVKGIVDIANAEYERSPERLADEMRRNLELFGLCSMAVGQLCCFLAADPRKTLTNENIVNAYSECIAVVATRPHRGREWDAFDEAVEEVKNKELPRKLSQALLEYPYERLVEGVDR